MRSRPALPISLGIVILAALAVGGCGSSDAGASPAGGSSQAGGTSQAGAASAGHGGNAGTAGGPATSGTGGSVGGAATAGASGGGAMAGASGSGGQGTADMSDPACPATLPAMGATCSTAGVCNYLDCAGAGQSIATCDGVKFTVTTTPCQSVPCGTTGLPAHALSCLPNEICVEHQGGNAWYECRPDPCAPATQACGCAGSLCDCNSVCSFQNFKLVCSCTGSCA